MMDQVTGSIRRWATAADFPQPPGVGANGRRLCRWCHGEVPKGSRSWCSTDCIDQYWVRASGVEVRRQVLKRDRGVCAICEIHAEKLRRVMYHAERHYWKGINVLTAITPIGRFDAFAGSYWQPDHIVPVSEGGGMCGLENYQTLCTPCHVDETAKLARRRAALNNPPDTRQIEIFERA